MAKRGPRPRGTLASLAAELEQLNDRRSELIQQIRALIGDSGLGEVPLPRSPEPPAASKRPGRRKGSAVSPETRRKMSLAAKKRWEARQAKKKKDAKPEKEASFDVVEADGN